MKNAFQRTEELGEAGVAVDDGVVRLAAISDKRGFRSGRERLVAQVHCLRC